MLDVLKLNSTGPGELCVPIDLITATHKLPALCSDLGSFAFVLSEI